MNTALLLLALVSSAQAAKEPSYHGKPPKVFCPEVEKVDQTIRSCADNQAFLQAARSCRKRFDRLKATVTADLQARLSAAALQQSQNFAGNSHDTREAALAHQYLITTGEKAVQELDDYFDFFEHPADAETDAEVLAERCYIEPAEGLNDLVNGLEEEVEKMKVAKGIESAISSTSSQNKNLLDSLTAPGLKATGAAPAGARPKPGKKLRNSDISGTKEEGKKP